jgi:hypothetical protein
MKYFRGMAALAAIVCAAGCQHDPNFQRAAADRAQAQSLPPLTPDERAVTFAPPIGPARDVTGGVSSVRLYLSVPLYPARGVDVVHSSIVVGGPESKMEFAGPFDRSERSLPGGFAREIKADNLGTDVLAATRSPVRAESSSRAGSIRAERSDYAEAMWAHLYGTDRIDTRERVASMTAAAEED